MNNSLLIISLVFIYICYTLWMTPRLAVAVNFAQFVALANHSKFSLEKKKKPQKKTT